MRSDCIVRCPTEARWEGDDLLGCGSTNVTWDDSEGFYDCHDCGLWFRPEDDDRKGAERKHYRKLHDGLSDMIEGGRLTESMIPDDYEWLVHMLGAVPKGA